jgi:hypothetical protein
LRAGNPALPAGANFARIASAAAIIAGDLSEAMAQKMTSSQFFDWRRFPPQNPIPRRTNGCFRGSNHELVSKKEQIDKKSRFFAGFGKVLPASS